MAEEGNREVIIQRAIADFNSKKFKSKRATALHYGLPLSTLSNRLKGVQTRAIANEKNQRLSPTQEKFLVDWIIDLDSIGFAPSPARAREMAIQILQMNNDTQPLGRDWLQKFKSRHLDIASLIGRKIEAKRIISTQPDAVNQFYDYFEAAQTDYNVSPENIWNMDEHGVGLGICTNSVVLREARKKHTYMQSLESRE